ncbi:putative transcription factor homeobox-WOX family [Helianthus annuus]|nr:putative transcription factor homeobox-WOX family [Helianthus annuus]
MVNHGVYDNNIILDLTLSSSMLQHNTTKKPCNRPNFDPSLTLALSGDHGITKKKHACDYGGLYGQDSGSGGGGGSSLISVASVCVKREREVKSEVISTTSEVEEEEDEDDDNSVNGRKKLRLTKAQSALLEEAFKHHSSLNPQKQKQELARELKLRPRQVEVWFQNRRARTKLKQTEVDCEYLKKCCETLKEENTRLHKELQELKALKQSTQPPYMQLPAATLTMCPSCKRIGDTTSSANTRPFSITPKPHFFNPFNNPSAAC